MVAIVSLLAIVTLSIVITRVATVMLTATGLSRDIARFQARSAFSGAGFTTSESESVVNHPVRRRFVMQLMLLGAAGVVTSLTSLLLSFTDATDQQTATRLLVLVGGLLALRLLAGSRIVDRLLTRVTEWALRRFTSLNVRDYDKLLHISDDFAVAELEPQDGDWITGGHSRSCACGTRASSSWASTARTASTSVCLSQRPWRRPPHRSPLTQASCADGRPLAPTTTSPTLTAGGLADQVPPCPHGPVAVGPWS